MANTKLPAHIAARFSERAIDPEGILRYVKGDMSIDRSYVDKIFAYDSENLYEMTGIEHVVQVRSAKKLAAEFEVSDFSVRPLSDIGRLTIDQMISSGRMVSETEDGRLEELAVFSVGRSNAFEIFAKNLNQFSNRTGEDDDGPIAEEPELFCPKCGTRYPDTNRKICPKCLSRSALTFRIIGLFRKYIPHAAIILFMLLLDSAVNIFSPYLSVSLIYDKVLVDESVQAAGGTMYFGIDLFHEIGLVVLALLGVRALNHLLIIIRNRFTAATVPKVVNDMKMRIFESMQRLSVGFYTSKQTGSLMYRVTGDSNNIYNFFISGIPHLLWSVTIFIGVLTMMFTISVKLTLIVILSVPVIVGLYMFLGHYYRSFYHHYYVHAARMNSLLSDSLYGQKVIKAFTQEDSENDRFSEHSDNVNSSLTNLSVSQTTTYPMVSMIMRFSTCILLIFGTVMVIKGELKVGLLLTMSNYLGMLFNPLSFFSNIANWWASCTDSAQRVFEIMDAQTDVPEPEDPVHVERLKGDFEAKDVMFEYEPGHPIVRSLSATVKSGQMLGIVGKTGAGKSTFVNLLARLYDPVEGQITLDGHDLKSIATADLRRNIGIVSQDIYLFVGSIADNIRYAKPDATIDEVIAAAKAACAHDFIIKMPDGYETRVGAGGQGLSGGERQRVSIARTMIQNPSILILDEATAAMDTETERNIQMSLTQLQQGRTTIAIAHRLSTLRDADKLAVIDKGRVIEYGTHQELLDLKGTYYKLYSLQMEALSFIGIK